MNSFGSGFAKGFLNALGTNMQKRKDYADKYFYEQMTRASELGLSVKKERNGLISTGVRTAKQLQQVGVPKEVIMAVANSDPKGLETLYSDIVDAQKRGVETNEEFFKDFVKVSEDFKPTDESWESFFSRVYPEVVRNAEADPEGFKRDRKGSIIATMMGYDAMDRANEKLARRGITPEALIDGGDRVVSPLGESTVTFDYTKTRRPEEENENKLSVSNRSTIQKAFDEELSKVFQKLGKSRNQLSEEELAEAKKAAADSVRELYGDITGANEFIDVLAGISEEEIEEPAPDVVPDYEPPATLASPGTEKLVPRRGTKEPVVEEPVTEEPLIEILPDGVTPDGESTVEDPEASFDAPIDLAKEPELKEPRPGVVYVGPSDEPGWSLYKVLDGSTKKISNAEIRKYVRENQ